MPDDKITTLNAPELMVYGGHATLYSPVSEGVLIEFFRRYVNEKQNVVVYNK